MQPDAPRRTLAARLATAVATVSGNAFLVLGTAVLAAIAIAVAFIPPRGRWMFLVARLWSRGLLAAGAVRVRVEMDPALDPAGRYVFLANHQSLFDIPLILATSPGPLRMLAKRNLFQIPLFGWALRAGGFIPVDREDRSTARGTFLSAAAHLRAGTSILLFPEGTRSPTGELLPFQRGGFLLALKSGLPIVPVGVSGTHAIQPRGRLAIRPGTAVVRYGAPLHPAEFGMRRKGELIEEVQRRVAELAGLRYPS
ncbi:MAG: lysophospholipid acyltransferase family protein [Thermoanaerobaculia bacterium]